MKKIKFKRKLSKKRNQRIKTLVLAIGLLICCCLVFVMLLAVTSSSKEIYKVDSRVKEIEKEKKSEDDEGIETIGWLRVQGTTIDAPIISYENVDYLNTIDKEDFLWNQNKQEKFFNQVSVSGHNVLNLSTTPERHLEYFTRFDDLMSFVYDDFVKDNKYIQYTIDGKDYIYKVFAVFFENDYFLKVTHTENFTEEEMDDFVNYAKESSFYDFDVDVDKTDSIITLTTCTRMVKRGTGKQLAVIGRLVREDEKLLNYDVKANEKYDAVKNIMKGDGQDETVQEV